MKLEKQLQIQNESDKFDCLYIIENFNKSQFDEVHNLDLAIIDLIKSTDLLREFYDKRFLHLRQKTPPTFTQSKKDLEIPNVSKYDYFVTLAFPNQGVKFNSYKTDFFKKKAILGNWQWSELKGQDQIKFVAHKIRQSNSHFKSLDLFYEYTKNGEIHIHCRCTINNVKSIKDCNLFFCDLFNLNKVKYPHFCFTKQYDDLKWSDYDTKRVKKYQTCDEPHIIINN